MVGANIVFFKHLTFFEENCCPDTRIFQDSLYDILQFSGAKGGVQPGHKIEHRKWFQADILAQ